MSVYASDPTKLTKSDLKTALIENSIDLPPSDARKDVYVELYRKHLSNILSPGSPARSEFSSDEESETPKPLKKKMGSPRRLAAKKEAAPSNGVADLSDEELREKLASYGVDVGPIVDSTRGIYRKKLLRLMSQAVNAEPVVVNGSAEEEDEFSDNDDEEEEEEEEEVAESKAEIVPPSPPVSTTVRKRPTYRDSPRTVPAPAESPRRSLRSSVRQEVSEQTYTKTVVDSVDGKVNETSTTTTVTQQSTVPEPAPKKRRIPILVQILIMILIGVLLFLVIQHMEPSITNPVPKVTQV